MHGRPTQVAGDLICELFPFMDMAKEAELLPPALLPLILLVDVIALSPFQIPGRFPRHTFLPCA